MSDLDHDCDDPGAPPLTRAETLVLWAIRAWVAGHRHDLAVLPNLRTAFRNEGAPAAAEAVDDLMAHIGHGAGRTIQVNCPRCRQVTDDERLLMDVIALHQEGETQWAPFLVRAILTPEATRASAPLFEALARALSHGGILLPTVTGPESRTGETPVGMGAHVMPPGATIH